jgi:hypothetical protein
LLFAAAAKVILDVETDERDLADCRRRQISLIGRRFEGR